MGLSFKEFWVYKRMITIVRKASGNA
ncbi:hypothetical protein EFER_1748 [Escherichia fergusonii ATCC 35469]|uniref:Uncharacterized protein n=1 Tax=Escherichia fergusonii (strain ATCC 35469 / DSM 13698 / CCUG 18766 / IAM 14443 / JCM 21226 / LMG 7866 / NBRC 102419 / NCTC 12128 / CDC 0568-73) TaxID=585054 RepID=B7LSH7_ESCF3|nr:hypothetical protein EFER_1748 [Escherichia fergusonii ATCC 35469]